MLRNEFVICTGNQIDNRTIFYLLIKEAGHLLKILSFNLFESQNKQNWIQTVNTIIDHCSNLINIGSVVSINFPIDPFLALFRHYGRQLQKDYFCPRAYLTSGLCSSVIQHLNPYCLRFLLLPTMLDSNDFVKNDKFCLVLCEAK